MILSLTEENYLKAIFHLSNHGSNSVSTNAIAEAMETKPASVSDMLRKLSNKKLINYKKYQGVKLTVDELLSLRQQASVLDLASKYQVSSTLAGGYRSKFRGRGIFEKCRIEILVHIM